MDFINYSRIETKISVSDLLSRWKNFIVDAFSKFMKYFFFSFFFFSVLSWYKSTFDLDESKQGFFRQRENGETNRIAREINRMIRRSGFPTNKETPSLLFPRDEPLTVPSSWH